jgi:hypothetical protein
VDVSLVGTMQTENLDIERFTLSIGALLDGATRPDSG